MMNIAPLDYERYAVLVNPLSVPDAAHVDANPPPRRIEQIAQVSTKLSRPDSRAGEELKGHGSRPTDLRRKLTEHDPGHPLNAPHPTDLNWLYQIPNEAGKSIQDQPTIAPLTVVELYDRPGKTRGATVRISG